MQELFPIHENSQVPWKNLKIRLENGDQRDAHADCVKFLYTTRDILLLYYYFIRVGVIGLGWGGGGVGGVGGVSGVSGVSGASGASGVRLVGFNLSTCLKNV